MLVLGRKFEQTINILTPSGELIEIRIIPPPTGIPNQSDVRIAIKADRDVIIERGELFGRPGGSEIAKRVMQ